VSIFAIHLTIYFREMEILDRITRQSDVMSGKACIRNMRVTVGMIVNQIGSGHSIEEILAEYPYLERDDIMQALRYAAFRVEEREIVFAGV
jgi:uncharacterized protein (DUF433 family)